MSVEQPQWPDLSQRTRSRLTAFSDRSHPASTTAPCRLPGCNERVERRETAGPPRFFHHRKCAVEFRTRRNALDAAVEERAELLESARHTIREAKRIRADLEWLLDQRSLYVPSGAWRRAPTDGETADADSCATDAYLHSVYLARRKPNPVDPCPTCKGSGDLKDLRDEITRPRNGRDYHAGTRIRGSPVAPQWMHSPASRQPSRTPRRSRPIWSGVMPCSKFSGWPLKQSGT